MTYAFKSRMGERFGRLVVIQEVDTTGALLRLGAKAAVLCRCDCGMTHLAWRAAVFHGNTSSCGCLQRENRIKHGRYGPGLYVVYRSMVQRCHDPNHDQYSRYGARGITVCDEWRASVEEFWRWAEPLWSEGLTIDRINNAKGYSPENCRFVSRKEQQRNKTNNRVVKFEDRSITIAEAAEIARVPYHIAYQRIVRAQWTMEELISKSL